MPPRPFPSQLGVGTDIVRVSRIRALIHKNGEEKAPQNLKRFLRRFLTYREQEEYFQRFNGNAAGTNFGNPSEKAMTYLAGRYVKYTSSQKMHRDSAELFRSLVLARWAAKEAVIKASSRNLSFFHIQILRAGRGVRDKPYGIILDHPASALFSRGKKPRSLKDSSTPASSAEPQVELKEKPEGNSDAVESGKSVLNGRGFIPSPLQDDNIPGQIVEISISHDGDYATAMCIAPLEPREGDVGGEAAAREPLRRLVRTSTTLSPLTVERP
jgi:holo-[acyl-carrier protein] synthase